MMKMSEKGDIPDTMWLGLKYKMVLSYYISIRMLLI